MLVERESCFRTPVRMKNAFWSRNQFHPNTCGLSINAVVQRPTSSNTLNIVRSLAEYHENLDDRFRLAKNFDLECRQKHSPFLGFTVSSFTFCSSIAVQKFQFKRFGSKRSLSRKNRICQRRRLEMQISQVWVSLMWQYNPLTGEFHPKRNLLKVSCNLVANKLLAKFQASSVNHITTWS